MNFVNVYAYPPGPHVRRHGPLGYADYGSFRDWLRDEFSFRCVFCLRREQWDRCLASFHIDHFISQSASPEKALDYENLLYVCASCNSVKGDLAVPGPCEVDYSKCLKVLDDGRICALNAIGERVIALLALDTHKATTHRKLILDTIRKLSEIEDRTTYFDWARFPDDLPDLAQKRPPKGNTRPRGVDECWFAKRSRGELPETY